MSKRLFANQNHITFKNVPKNKNNSYGVYDRTALFQAMENLSRPAFKLYLYLGSYRGLKEGLYLSKQDALEVAHLDERSYFSAKKELKEKGYLIKDTLSSDKHTYILIEDPN